MISRELSQKILELFSKSPAIGLMGPRQSGKTTLVRELFPSYPYVSFEDLAQRERAQNNIVAFLEKYQEGAIFDEVQHVPALFSYLQGVIDNNPKPGRFILTGSQNFTLSEHISQTLAGRIALLTLLPLSIEELKKGGRDSEVADELIFNGGYPRIYSSPIGAADWYRSYILTYVERDVRQIKNINNLSQFQTFLKLCAGRIGQVLNLSSLGNDCGLSGVTIRHWLSILQASYVVYLLPPHYQNFNKRLIKMPKIYFYDTGVACSLLGIEDKKDLQNHYLRGNLFENLVMNEILKHRLNQGKSPNIYFWRDNVGHEVDCIYDRAGHLLPIEIKSSRTLSSSFYDNLKYFNKIAKQDVGILCYGGSIEEKGGNVHTTNYKNIISTLEGVLKQ